MPQHAGQVKDFTTKWEALLVPDLPWAKTAFREEQSFVEKTPASITLLCDRLGFD